jgi:hypothetical protein
MGLKNLVSVTLKEGHRLRVFENRMLKRIFGSKRDEVAGGWRRLHNEEFHNLYALPYSIRVVEVRRMRRMRCVGRERTEMHTKRCSENLKGRDQSEDLGIDGK